ncbi:hypothetical protein DRQ09_03655 [candidate division KSB1 bacterium]|nr:MAG: hypothetical protein DRQ09_03655 [candidate division KSB1 bacterium]
MIFKLKNNLIILSVILLFFTFQNVIGQEKISSGTLNLTVKESVEIALKKSKKLLLAKSKIEEEYDGVGISRTAFLPKISTVFNYTRLDYAPFFPAKAFMKFGGGGQLPPGQEMPKKITIGDENNYAAAFTVQQPIYTGGALRNSYRISELKAYNAEVNFEKSKNELVYDVEKAYWSVVKAQEFKKVAEEAIKQVNSHLKDLENMYQVGMVTENDLLMTKVQLSNAELALIQAKNGIKLAKIAFCNVLGIPLDTDVIFIDKLKAEPVPEINLEKMIKTAFSKRPEINSFEANIEIGRKAVNISKAGYFPNIFLNADYGYRRPDRFYNRDFYGTWTVSMVFQFNLFDWGETSLKVSRAKKQLKQIEITKKQLEDGITLEVTQSYLSLLEAKEKIDKCRLNVKQAEENYRVTNEKFKEGLATNTNLLDANTLLVQARTNYISALADYKVALAALKKSTGEVKF